jgi:isoleucyl-tRNA synthetase
MTQLSEAYRKIRNTFRFALGNLYDFDPARDALPNEQLEEMDRWMIERTAGLAQRCRDWYWNDAAQTGYDFHRVYHAIHDFCVVDLSAFYFDVLKDRLYTKAARNRARRSAQTAIYKITSALVRLLAPILVFTAEEVWKFLPKAAGDPASVHVSVFPEKTDLGSGLEDGKRAAWEKLLQIRSDVLSALETARDVKTIGGSLEARVAISPRTDLDAETRQRLVTLLKDKLPQLPSLFIASQVDIKTEVVESPGSVTESAPRGELIITVQRADGTKCARCWNYSTRVGENKRYPTVCERCSEAISEIEQSPPS